MVTLAQPTADLFDYAAAVAAKLAGMADADAGADPEWSAQMQLHALATARAMRFFTSDDVAERAQAAGMSATTHDRRAFGPVMLRLAKAGVCRKAECAPVNSRRASLHASPLRVWESLVYQGDA